MRVSRNGGSRPAWSPTKDELYYVSGDSVLAVGYRIEDGEFRAGTPRALLNLPQGHYVDGSFEVSADGKRFLIRVDSGQDPPPTELHVTTNWFQELKRLAPRFH